MFNKLVVDDDNNIRRLLTAVLTEAGYNIFPAEDGIKALEVMDRNYIDLAVVDIMMPRMNGYEFTQLLREQNNECLSFFETLPTRASESCS